MIYTHSYFIFNGKKSSMYDILVEEQPAIIKPQRKAEAFEIPGKSGLLHVDNNAYESYIKTVTCSLMSVKYLDEIIKWLDGMGDVVFSNEKNKKYEAVVFNVIPFSKVFGMKKYRFPVQFDCQPFKYELTQEPVILAQPGQLHNPGTMAAEPIITVYGTGSVTVSINWRSFSLAGITDYIVVDSRMLCAYRANTELMNHRMTGGFPCFDTGENSISWTGNIQRLEILPYWRWL
jgi:phage-related protein